MNVIQLTDVNKTPVGINIQHIIYFAEETPGSTKMILSGDNIIVVQQSVDQIAKMLNGEQTPSHKIFTFRFHFMNPNSGFDDATEFCAETQAEAERLFEMWAINDEHMSYVPSVNEIERVYQQDDADEYGENYGRPEEYPYND